MRVTSGSFVFIKQNIYSCTTYELVVRCEEKTRGGHVASDGEYAASVVVVLWWW